MKIYDSLFLSFTSLDTIKRMKYQVSMAGFVHAGFFYRYGFSDSDGFKFSSPKFFAHKIFDKPLSNGRQWENKPCRVLNHREVYNIAKDAFSDYIGIENLDTIDFRASRSWEIRTN